MAETENQNIHCFGEYELGLGFLYTHRIPASEFVQPYRWVNFHPGPLPEFRGRNLAYHAIMQGVPSFGATIHYMAEEFDTGEIIDIERFAILPSDTAGDLVRRSHDALEGLFKSYVPRLLEGRVPSYPQGKEGQYYRKSLIADVIALSEEQERKIRALTVVPKFYGRVKVAGRTYNIVPD